VRHEALPLRKRILVRLSLLRCRLSRGPRLNPHRPQLTQSFISFRLCPLRINRYLEVLAIHPTYQRQGLGNTLLSTQLSSLPADQAVQLESTPAGQGLYRKFGFEVVDTLKVVGRGGKGLDIPVMVKKPSKMG
jgi:ribosomal protein S18 acetylase RimI-like enzyme